MTEKKNPETVIEETVTAEPVKKEKPKKNPKKESKPRKPRARKVEELINEATKKMTDKEKDILISFLREDSTKLNNQIVSLKQTIESAFAQCRELEKQYESMEKYYRDSLQYIDGQVIAFANAVRKSTVGGTN